MSVNFSNLTEFLERTSSDDREFLAEGDLFKLPEAACAFANSSGGWIIFPFDEDSSRGASVYIVHYEFEIAFEDLISFVQSIRAKTEKIIALYIPSASWNEKPMKFDGKIFRRVEGQNIISNRRAAAVIAGDSLTSSRDDRPAMNCYINLESLNDFYQTVINSRAEYEILKPSEFLGRSYIFSGKYLTFAGALMFSNILRIRASCNYSGGRVELTALNIWEAYKNILPRILPVLSYKCGAAFREIFINSLLHSDYELDNKIFITMTSNPSKVLINNPGIIRSASRNKRLEKIFRLAKISTGQRGMTVIKNYSPSFKLNQDMLNFRVSAELKLEGPEELPRARIL